MYILGIIGLIILAIAVVVITKWPDWVGRNIIAGPSYGSSKESSSPPDNQDEI